MRYPHHPYWLAAAPLPTRGDCIPVSLVVKFIEFPSGRTPGMQNKWGPAAMNVGHAIRLCRTQRGVSQSEVARGANCSVSYLSMLENNKRDPTLSTVTRIAQALHVPIGVLFFLASDNAEMGQIDERLAGELEKFALAALAEPAEKAAHE